MSYSGSSFVYLILVVCTFLGPISCSFCNKSIILQSSLLRATSANTLFGSGLIMDTEEDYTVAKSIVQSGQLDEEWDSIRQGKGIWPVEKETWKQFRAYSMQELKDEMKIFKQSKGNMNFHAFRKIS